MRQRLAVAGVRSISLAVDITNYVMLELGQPMHAFDRDRLAGPLVVRRAAAGEKLTTLDGVTARSTAEDMVITRRQAGPISLAAVMGGETTEMSPTTTDVLFEAAHWDPATVGRTVRRHKLSSEAAKRFERGVDPELPRSRWSRPRRLLTELAGGTAGERGARHRPRRAAHAGHAAGGPARRGASACPIRRSGWWSCWSGRLRRPVRRGRAVGRC